MVEPTTAGAQDPSLVGALLAVLAAHRPAFRQERVYRRVVALVMAELFVFARHTLTQRLWALGLLAGDWSAWYRLFSRPRFEEVDLAHALLVETLREVRVEEPYVVATDATQIPPRSHAAARRCRGRVGCERCAPPSSAAASTGPSASCRGRGCPRGCRATRGRFPCAFCPPFRPKRWRRGWRR